MKTSISEPATLVRQLAQLLRERGIFVLCGKATHAFAIGIDDPARPSLPHSVARLQMRDSFPLRGERQNFFAGRSFSAALSSVASAINRLGFPFSSSRERSRPASDTSSPPYFDLQL